MESDPARSTPDRDRLVARLREWMPSARALPAPAWAPRHRAVVGLLYAHAVGLVAFGLYQGLSLEHAVFEGGIVAVVALLASVPRFDQRLRSVIAAMGLISSSAILTHLSGGYIEAHFHFFVMLGVISLYEDWIPFLLSIGYVALHHGVVGTIDPRSVYNHPDAIADPWQWALIHATFIMAMSVANIFTWRVTEQARLKAAESSARHAAILASSLDAIITIDERGRVVEFNPAAERIFGYARDDAIGREMTELIIPPSEREAHRRALALLDTSGRSSLLERRLELTAMRKDGSVFHAELALVPTRGTRATLFTGYLRDLTAQHEAKRELESARLQLTRSEKMIAIGQLVSGVAHEARTPLTYLNTNIHLLKSRLERVRSELPREHQDALEDVPERLADIVEAAARIDRLVEDLRRYSKLKGGVQRRGGLQDAVKEAVGLFAATHRGNVRVETDLRDTPLVRLDPVQVQQMVLNLLQNAAEAHPAADLIRVETRRDGDGALLAVEDDGGGIPARDRDLVFDPFFTTKPEGTGLGLSIVKRLVEEHNATIRLVEPGGGGTRFEIRFPAPSHEIPVKDPEEPQTRRVSG